MRKKISAKINKKRMKANRPTGIFLAMLPETKRLFRRGLMMMINFTETLFLLMETNAFRRCSANLVLFDTVCFVWVLYNIEFSV